MKIKDIARSFLNFLHLDLTKNLEYDRLTKAIMHRVIHDRTNCIDVGCHKGEMLDVILKLSPHGLHYAFEPIPIFYNALLEKYAGKATIFPYALSNENGETIFNYVKNAPAYSGLNKREYDVEIPEIEEINVEVKTLDELIPEDVKIGFIKIDVEGGEFNVLKGGKALLERNKPVIIFECGLGASEYYGTTPHELFNFFAEAGFKLATLKSFLKHKKSISISEFVELYDTNVEYYFVAYS